MLQIQTKGERHYDLFCIWFFFFVLPFHFRVWLYFVRNACSITYANAKSKRRKWICCAVARRSRNIDYPMRMSICFYFGDVSILEFMCIKTFNRAMWTMEPLFHTQPFSWIIFICAEIEFGFEKGDWATIHLRFEFFFLGIFFVSFYFFPPSYQYFLSSILYLSSSCTRERFR